MSLSALNLRVQLPLFEGPLALLLYLIRKEEMDIMDIKIHLITHQYLEYIKMMREMDLEVAGEFVAMAATLIQIKSQMLLPHYNEKGEEVILEDPRKHLVQKLMEYQKFQEAAQLLNERPLLGRDIFTRGVKEKWETEPELDIEENALFGLISMFRSVMRSAEKRVHKVAKKMQSIAGRISEIKNKLILNTQIPMRTLLVRLEDRRQELLITFLSTLELAKMGFVKLFQTDTYQEIYIEAVKPLDDISLARVEEYDSHPSEALTVFESPAASLETNNQVEYLDEQIDQMPNLNILTGEDNSDEDSYLAQESDKPEEMATDEDILNAEKELGDRGNETEAEADMLTI